MKSVYNAVRTGSLNKAVCASSLTPTILSVVSYRCEIGFPAEGVDNRLLGITFGPVKEEVRVN